MIALRIEAVQQEQAMDIIELLLRQSLISDVSLYSNVPSLRLHEGNIAHGQEAVIAATTQPNLYNSIEKSIRIFCNGGQLPLMYSMPM